MIRRRYFHRTTAEAAALILAGGFQDGVGAYLTPQLHCGVWLSDVPLDENEGAKGDELLVVKIAPRYIAPYEWREAWKPYREFLVPAHLLNRRARVRRVPFAEEDRVVRRLMRREKRR